MPPERIVPLPSSENFWSVGGPGPCGPDSEMYWDWGEEVGCGNDDCLPGCTRCERFLEFGNLVFMSYELHADGTLTELPTKNIDTGWGLERVARVVQDVASVYDTDGYRLIMDWVDGAVRRGVRLVGRRDEGASRARRPRPRDDVHRRRGRLAVERGARLRPAAHRPARDAARPADRDEAAVPAGPGRRRDRADGPGVSRARRAPGRDPPRARGRGGALRRDARARDGDLRGSRGKGRDHRRGRLRAADDVRLPDRAHARSSRASAASVSTTRSTRG